MEAERKSETSANFHQTRHNNRKRNFLTPRHNKPYISREITMFTLTYTCKFQAYLEWFRTCSVAGVYMTVWTHGLKLFWQTHLFAFAVSQGVRLSVNIVKIFINAVCRQILSWQKDKIWEFAPKSDAQVKLSLIITYALLSCTNNYVLTWIRVCFENMEGPSLLLDTVTTYFKSSTSLWSSPYV